MMRRLSHILTSSCPRIILASLLSACTLADSSVISAPQSLSGWRTDTGKRAIDLSELLSGGVPKDGIPAINQPRFVSMSEAKRWLKPQEPVISLEIGGEARAYPLQILIWHEIVNDRIDDTPVAVTFCPLCYSAVAFDRTIGGRVHTFGVSGMLRNSDMVMYDRETESLWQQLTGEAIVGEMTGIKLARLPAQIISFEQFASAYKDVLVLSRETGFRRDYGRNPYAGYDDIIQRPFLYRGKIDNRLAPMERVVTLNLNGVNKVYPYSVTRKLRVIHDEVGGSPVVIFHGPGAISALDQAEISSSRQSGSVGVFDPRVGGKPLRFKFAGGKFLDEETGSEWDIIGQAVEGKLKGKRLAPIAHGAEFAFAWLAFKPKSVIYRR